MKYKKYIIIIITIIFVLITCIVIFIHKTPISIEGKILINMKHTDIGGITVYECSKRAFQELALEGKDAKFLDDSTIFLQRSYSIIKYDLNTGEEAVVYTNDELIDFFVIINEKYLSIAVDDCIFLYDTETSEKTVLVQGCLSSEFHAWSKNGDVLYYSDTNGKIVAYNILTGEFSEVGEGYHPTVCGSYIAYREQGNLIVKNMQTNKEYKYSGSAYDFCFSPDGSKMVIEDEISGGTFFKNLFTGGIVLGHSIVIWDYKSNRVDTIVDACKDLGYMICDWK